MHICLTIPNLSKRGGGPAAVVQNLSEQLVASGASVTVVTEADTDGRPEALPRDQRVNIIHAPAGMSAGLGRSFSKTLEEALTSGNASIVHDFGIWSPVNHAVASACKKLRIPRVCSPCGMLAQWALRHKAWKKRLAWWLYQRRDLSRATMLVATAEQEVLDIRRRVPNPAIALIPNGTELPLLENLKAESRKLKPEMQSQRTLLFLGRIHPVKGLTNLVEAWRRVRPSGWRCILAGPDQAGHRAELETLLQKYNLADVFAFPGMMEDEQKWSLLRSADLFVLPSFTENFGVAAAEALACGVPVITTKGTPWREVIDQRCGWWVDIGAEPLAVALREATSLSHQQRYEMGQRGRRLVGEKYSWPQIGRVALSMYRWVLHDGPQPPCIRLAKDERNPANESVQARNPSAIS